MTRAAPAFAALAAGAVINGAVIVGADAGWAADATAQANNPLAETTAINVQNQFTGNFTGIDEPGNAFLLRAAQPYAAFGGTVLVRATLPVVTLPVGPGFDQRTGFGDFNLLAFWLFDTGSPAISFGLGPQLTVPSANDDRLGSEKWSAGVANVLFNATSPKLQWGYLATWQASFAGEDERRDVNIAAVQPFLFYQLGDGWYLRSTGVSTYDFETDAYAAPLGLGIGRVIKTKRAVVNVFAEPQYSLASKGDLQPEWGTFAGINFQF